METLTSIRTPALVLEEAKLSANIARVHAAIERHAGVSLRPHFKTAKSIEVAARTFHKSRKATVSTLREAEYLAANGVLDILYAVGISGEKLRDIGRLQSRGVRIAIVLDDLDVARSVAAWAASSSQRLPVLIEIDTDGQRAGVHPDSAQLIAIAQHLAQAAGVELAGVMTHAGASYDCKARSEIIEIAEAERRGAVQAAERIRAAGMRCEVVSVGSTPTILCAENLRGVTEARVGVAYFNDLTMVGLGICTPDDVALTVLTTVIGHQASRHRVIVDAGWMALSADRGRASQHVFEGYGLVADLARRLLPGVGVFETNQEHGVLGSPAGTKLNLEEFPIGRRLRILPNHACATAAAFGEYQLESQSGKLVARWPRCTGW